MSIVGTVCAPPLPLKRRLLWLSLQKIIKVTSDSWPDKEDHPGEMARVSKIAAEESFFALAE